MIGALDLLRCSVSRDSLKSYHQQPFFKAIKMKTYAYCNLVPLVENSTLAKSDSQMDDNQNHIMASLTNMHYLDILDSVQKKDQE